MLNHIWMGMLAIGILVAVGRDVSDEVRNPYRNGRALDVRFEKMHPATEDASAWEGELVVDGSTFSTFYGISETGQAVREKVRLTSRDGRTRLIVVPTGGSPELWRTMATAATTKGQLAGAVNGLVAAGGVPSVGAVVFDPTRFIKLRAVTSAALDIADTAVQLAIGLIGIMALWLGIIKVAEQAGLIAIVTRMLRPLTRRLFPEIPADHPAVGAMIMNIAANMLGLNNAATPMGLKAMEELNKLNPKAGTATNAMCTFLVINTAGLTLIPATAMAIRAAVGSANPGIIIGTSIFGAGCATVAGLVAAKILQRLPRYRVQEARHD